MLIARMKIRSLVDLSTFGYFCVPSLCAIFVVSPYVRKIFFYLDISCLISGANSMMRPDSALSMSGQLIKVYFKLVLKGFSTLLVS